ncbi:Uncharacterised protein [Vibrio cholerae]|nr:Uncharacterised protein [Vibrio cholerae]
MKPDILSEKLCLFRSKNAVKPSCLIRMNTLNRRPRWQHCKAYAPRSMHKVRLPQVMLLELTMVPVR